MTNRILTVAAALFAGTLTAAPAALASGLTETTIELDSGMMVRPDSNCKDAQFDKRISVCFDHKDSGSDDCSVKVFGYDQNNEKTLIETIKIKRDQKTRVQGYLLEMISKDKSMMGRRHSCIVRVSKG